jgi:hypothetical protein
VRDAAGAPLTLAALPGHPVCVGCGHRHRGSTYREMAADDRRRAREVLEPGQRARRPASRTRRLPPGRRGYAEFRASTTRSVCRRRAPTTATARPGAAGHDRT